MENVKICVIGLGYVGLPLATLFAEKYPVVGYDINSKRINQLKKKYDTTLEVDTNKLDFVLVDEIPEQKGLYCTYDYFDIKSSNFYIITVPTPVDEFNRPDLKPLLNASKLVGSVIKSGDVIVFESTVFPSATEDYCVPKIEKESGLRYNIDFFVGYSPERVNPSDKVHTIDKIMKVTSGSTPEIADYVDNVYKSIITAGTHKASSIKVAEASKIIENAQRDVNIAFMNEVAKIFNRLDINTNDVLKASGTKWNFLPFKQGLVGGHCIGVDPYYLTQKALELEYTPELIQASRKINDSMGKYVADEVIRMMIINDLKIKNSNTLILGFTFKENCTDFRNTKVVDIYNQLKYFGIDVDIYDPWASPSKVLSEYNIRLLDEITYTYDAIILAVAHDEFKKINLNEHRLKNTVVYDVKGFFNEDYVQYL